MTEIGKYNQLRIVKKTDFGLYLDGVELGEILLPNKYVPAQYELDDLLDVFIYTDSEDRLIATTEHPYAIVGEIAFLKVKAVNFIGAFMDWGLLKDLLVPFKEQKIRMETGKSYMVYLYLDTATNRIAATSKIEKHALSNPINLTEGQEVNLTIYQSSELGYKAIINKQNMGIIYKNEVFTPLFIGQEIKGYIKKIRPDNKIDLYLQKGNREHFSNLADKILHLLNENNGHLALSDKSSPDMIYQTLGVSKKNFKIAIGKLYKERKINISESGISLI